MKVPNKNYTDAQLDLLYGQIGGTKYAQDVQAVLTEWKKMGTVPRSQFKRVYDSGYIRQVVNRIFYNELVWDAVAEVIRRRRDKKAAKAASISDLVELATV